MDGKYTGRTRGRQKCGIRTRTPKAPRMRYGKWSEMRGEVKQKGTESTDERTSAFATRAHAEFVIEPGELIARARVCLCVCVRTSGL